MADRKTNCVNCGAPLHGEKCQYCGTEYVNNNVVAEFDQDNWTGTLFVGGKEFQVYIGNMEITDICSADSGRMVDGTMYRQVLGRKHRFNLTEL